MKLCFDADEKCKSKEVLQHEIKKSGFQTDKQIVVIPENVQDLDQSDGSIPFVIEEWEMFKKRRKYKESLLKFWIFYKINWKKIKLNLKYKFHQMPTTMPLIINCFTEEDH